MNYCGIPEAELRLIYRRDRRREVRAPARHSSERCALSAAASPSSRHDGTGQRRAGGPGHRGGAAHRRRYRPRSGAPRLGRRRPLSGLAPRGRGPGARNRGGGRAGRRSVLRSRARGGGRNPDPARRRSPGALDLPRQQRLGLRDGQDRYGDPRVLGPSYRDRLARASGAEPGLCAQAARRKSTATSSICWTSGSGS